MEYKYIRCRTKELMRELLKKLESDGYTWMSCAKPTKLNPWDSYKEDTILFIEPHKYLVYGNSNTLVRDGKKYTEISADEILNKGKPVIVIYRNGRTVTALHKKSGEKGVAKCSPDDEFVFKTGAAIALARLMAKTPEVLTDDVKAEWKKVLGIADTAKPESKFRLGDFVTLKEGVEVRKWYGGLELLSGSMHDFAYHKRMKVVAMEWQDDVGTYYYECYHDGKFTFHYSEEMLDKWDESKIHEGDTVKVINTGLNYSSYAQWVGEHISDPYMAARYCFGSPSMDEKYKVIKIAEHERNHIPLAYIEETDGLAFNKCYLIEVKGLVKV